MLARPPCSATNRTATVGSPWYRSQEPRRRGVREEIRGVREEIRWPRDAGCQQPVPWSIRIRNATPSRKAAGRSLGGGDGSLGALGYVASSPRAARRTRRPTDGAGVVILSPESSARARRASIPSAVRPVRWTGRPNADQAGG